jgi:hypothetical protein
MKAFTDNTGRSWTVSLNIGTLKRVRSLCEVDLMAAVEGKLIERLIADPVLLCDILYVVCKDEADKYNVTDEDFGRSLGGDAIDYATTALLEELVDFFPQRRREVLRKALHKLNQLQEKSAHAAMLFLESPELEMLMEQTLTENFGTRIGLERGGEGMEKNPSLDATMPARAPGGDCSGSLPAV